MEHFLDGDRGEPALPAAHHEELVVRHAAFTGLVLQRITGEQVDAGQAVLEFRGAVQKKDEILAGSDGREMRAIDGWRHPTGVRAVTRSSSHMHTGQPARGFRWMRFVNT